jgi:phosphoribosylformylglycinamidine synthase PurS subunit
MPTYHAELLIATRANVLHPESRAVEEALHQLGHTEVSTLQVSKHISFRLEAPHEADAQKKIEVMTHELLANPVIEDMHLLNLNVGEASS